MLNLEYFFLFCPGQIHLGWNRHQRTHFIPFHCLDQTWSSPGFLELRGTRIRFLAGLKGLNISKRSKSADRFHSLFCRLGRSYHRHIPFHRSWSLPKLSKTLARQFFHPQFQMLVLDVLWHKTGITAVYSTQWKDPSNWHVDEGVFGFCNKEIKNTYSTNQSLFVSKY